LPNKKNSLEDIFGTLLDQAGIGRIQGPAGAVSRFDGWKRKINPKSEILNKFKIQNSNDQNTFETFEH